MASDADLYCSHLRYLTEIYAWLPFFLCRPPIGGHLVYPKTQNPRCSAASDMHGARAHARTDVVTLVGGLVYWSQIVEAVAAKEDTP